MPDTSLHTGDTPSPFRNYSIRWIDIDKRGFFGDRKNIFSSESGNIRLPFFDAEKKYAIDHLGKTYLANENQVKESDTVYTNKEIGDIPEDRLYTGHCIMLGILIQSDFEQQGNPYELFFYFRKILESYFESRDIEPIEWFPIMTGTISIIYGFDTGELFYKNFSYFSEEPSASFEDIILETMEFMKKDSQK